MKSRRLFLLVNAFVLVLSLLTALRVLPGPETVGMALAFYALFLFPGYAISRLVSRRNTGLLEDICRVFLAGLLFLSMILALGFVPGISYGGIAVAASAVNGALLLLVAGSSRRTERERSPIPAERKGEHSHGRMQIVAVALLFVVCFVLFYGSGETGWDSDALDHISYVRRALDGGALFPDDSFHRNGDGAGFDPRKGIWHPMMALWAFQGDTRVEVLWRALPSFIAFFALAAFLLFVATVTGRPKLAPLALLMFLLFYRGEGIGWLTKAGFSRNMAQVALWSGAAFMVRYAESRRRDLLCWVCAAAFFGAACHPVFALNMASTSLALLIFVLFFRCGRSWRRGAVTATAAAAAAAALPLALRAAFAPPSVNLIHAHRQGMMILGGKFAVVDPAELVARLGPAFFFALLLVPFFLWVADGGERRKLSWTLFLLPVLLVLNPLTGGMLEGALGYLHYRMLYAAPLFCYLGLAVAGLARVVSTGRSEGGRRSKGTARAAAAGRGIGMRKGGARFRIGPRFIAACLLVLFVYFPLRLALPVARRSVVGILDQGGAEHRPQIAERLDSILPDHSVIASDPRTSYIVSAFTDHFVTVTLDQHCSPSDTAALRRLQETRDLFSPAVPFSNSSGWLLEEGVGYLLVDANNERRTDFFGTVPAGEGWRALRKFRGCRGILDETASFDGFHLFRLDREAMAAGTDLARSGTAGGAEECSTGKNRAPTAEVSAEGIALAGIVVDRAEITAGDTLRGRLCWSIDGEIEFGLPYEWTLRLDGDFPRGILYRPWYGKQYRRWIERKQGEFYRFTHSERLSSGGEQPDQWEPGSSAGQDFAIRVGEWLHEGRYVMRVSIRRLPYLPNRTIGDYLLNEDSFHGVPVDSLWIRRKGGPSGETEHGGGKGI